MSVLDLFGKDGAAANVDATDPHWAKTRQGHYNRLIFVDPERLGLAGPPGIYIIWHAGVRPEWVYAAKCKDLAVDLDSIQDNDDVMFYDRQGGLFVTWALVREEHHDGGLSYLFDNMNPLVENPNPPKKKIKRLPVLLPTDSVEKKGKKASKG